MRRRRHSLSGRVVRNLLGALSATILVWGGAAADDDLPVELKTIAAVHFEGRRHVPEKALLAVMKTKRPSIFPWRDRPVLRRDFLIADALSIQAVYHQYGYLDADAVWRVGSTKGTSTSVTFAIREGPRSRIEKVDLDGVVAIPRDPLRKKLYARVGRPFNPAYLIADTSRIAAAYQEKGYLPHVVGIARRDSVDSLRVTVSYLIREGPQYRVGEVYVSTPGEMRVKEQLVRRELLLRRGDVYRASKAQRSVERLYETSLFSQVQMTPLVDSTNTLVEFDLRVRERKPRWFDAGVGSGTAERFRFTGEWGHRNLSGQGLQGVIASRLAFDGRARFLLTRTEASLLEPWLARSRTRGVVRVYYENRDDRGDPRWVVNQEAKGVSFEARRDLGRFTRINLTQDNAFVTQRIDLLDPNLSPEVRDSLVLNVRPSYTTHRIQAGSDRDTRDNPLNPQRGSAQNLIGEIAGGPLRGTSSFVKWQTASAWYSPVGRDMILASRIRFGAIDPFGKNSQFSPEAGLDDDVARVPLEDRFRIGGVNSLRGFEENSVPASGGLAVVQANLELRVPVAGPFGLEFFVDAGNVWARPQYLKADDFVPRATRRRLAPGDVRYTFGTGARVNLPFGPLRIDFSWTPRPDENGIWKVAEPQFAIGPSF